MRTLEEFSREIDKAVVGILELRSDEGHYAIIGYDLPLSVTRQEGQVLFAVARAFGPRKVLELGTGTGYSTAWLAAAVPDAEITTIDDFNEGGTGDMGLEATMAILDRTKAVNVSIHRTDFFAAQNDYMEWSPHMIFADGILSRSILNIVDMGPGTIMALHDITDRAFIKDPCAVFVTASKLGFHGTVEDVERARRAASLFVHEDSFG
ncbi:MAG: hypothetical protein ACE5JI_11600 [Acidobacteriota bacterium]